MKAIDTNILVYAEMTSSTCHTQARGLLTSLAEGEEPWAIPWPCIYELLRVITHPKVFHPPMALEPALDDIESILASPSLLLLSETERHPAIMSRILKQSRATGNIIHDAHIAALCIEHGIAEFLTGDADFTRFSALKVTNPFSP